MAKYFSGIRTQLIAGIALVTVGAIALIGFLSVRMLEWNSLYRKGKEAEVIVAFIQPLAQEAKGFEGNAFKGFISKIAENGVIRDMTVMDENGKAVFVAGKGLSSGKEEGKKLFSIGGLNIKMVGGGWWTGVGKELLVSAPLKHEAGTVLFSMPLSDIRQETANFKKFILFYAVFDSIIIIAFGAYLFSRGIIRPMKHLKETAENIAGGALEQRVGIKAGGEIGSFALSFNIMADRLEEKIRTLERLNKELIATQEELVRSEKLATVGRLAAGVAHEIGNPLGAMLGYVDILKKAASRKQEAVNSESEEILKRLGMEIERIDKIVRGLLDFSRPSKKTLHEVDVNKSVGDSVAMLLPQFSDGGISFDMRLGEHIPRIRADEGMMRQVLLNLFLNARDAMEKGGVVAVETSVAKEEIRSYQPRAQSAKRRKEDSSDADFTAVRKEVTERKSVIISVSDTGKGISEDDIEKIFDPFFTTKEQGKGTGLGLAISLGIVRSFGGDIKVKSRVGKGTAFEVILPV